jgi:DNA (cytosine-5)-methyltransferase 1
MFDDVLVGPTVWEAISDLQGIYADTLNESCNYAKEPQTDFQAQRRNGVNKVSNHFPWKLSERQLQRIRLLSEGQGQAHLPKELQTADGYGSAYRRLQSTAQALTITTWMFHPGSGMFTHPFEDRVITIREAARIQSFQDDFTFFGKYHSQCRQVGNSVAPLVAKRIALSILQVLGYKQTQLEDYTLLKPKATTQV